MSDNRQTVDTDPVACYPDPVTLQPYTKPAIVHELRLETRAGSPLGHPNAVDPLGIDPTQP